MKYVIRRKRKWDSEEILEKDKKKALGWWYC
jgi:hypothetical protein